MRPNEKGRKITTPRKIILLASTCVMNKSFGLQIINVVDRKLISLKEEKHSDFCTKI